jgi:hypothetical protein
MLDRSGLYFGQLGELLLREFSTQTESPNIRSA